VHLRTIRVPEWPPLAWLAVCPPGSDELTGYVGDHVETSAEWFCEAVWDGPFLDGGFDETDVVFGSGVRIRDGRVVFVPSGGPIDRLHSIRTADGLFVSNSFPCLLSAVGGALDLANREYRAIFGSIVLGLDGYEREIPTTVGPVRQTYFDNLVWDGTELREDEKPFDGRDIGTYAKYRAFLGGAVQALAVNATTAERSHPLGLTSSLSSGYDSSAVTVLAHEAGCTEAIGFDRDKAGADDSGARLAESLGLRYHELESSRAPNADVLFLAAVVGDGGDAFLELAEEHMAGRLVFFGHWGDRIWGLEDRPLHTAFLRADTSGNDVSEYRLVAGFIQCAVPFLGGRQLGEILAMSHDPELQPWDIGGTYSRPICRRIVEEAGVPRDAFGMHKRALFVGRLPRPENFLTPELRADYLRWLRARRWQFLRRRMVPPSPAWDALTRWLGRLDPTARRRLHRYVIHWAVDRTKERYPPPPTDSA
jgi:hypothetical protein